MQTPFETRLPTKPLKYIAPLVGEKADEVPADGRYIGLEQIEPWAGALSGIELAQKPEGAANTFQPGDILFGKLRPYLAKAWVADSAGYCTTEGLVLRSSCSDPRYVRYCLLTTEAISAIDGSTFGSKMPRADWEFIGALQLPCPSREAQEKIANFLDDKTGRIDALIAEKERLVETIEEFQRSSLWEILTEGFELSAGKRDSGVEWIGEVSSHWTVKRLKWLTPILRGASPRPIDDPKYFDEEGEYAWVRIADVSASDGYLHTTQQQLSTLGASLSVKREPGDLFLSIAGTVGKPCIAKIKCCIHDGFVWFPGLKDDMLRDWLFNIFEAGVAYAGLGKMGTQLNLNTDTVGSIQIPLPPKDEMGAILEKIGEMKLANSSLRHHVMEHLARLREYRSSLISAAVTGQIDVGAYEVAA